jgi:tRNA U34 5-methylaminomethyl-2-thiouridine-forming methyltransferase MnmC
MPRHGYQLVHLHCGTYSLRSLEAGETFHPAIGPVAEAEALYVKQLNLRDRIEHHAEEFVVWDVGLGAAANALTVLRATRDMACKIRLVSFDHTSKALEFGLQHARELGYFNGQEERLRGLLSNGQVTFRDGPQSVHWEFLLGDFPDLIASAAARRDRSGTPDAGTSAKIGVAPHAILFDAFSPARNPAMWTLPVFTHLYQLLDPQRPCTLPTYSRSTILRVTLLLAGFYVGVGHATGSKTETTIAANVPVLLDELLDRRWLERARRSHSAEPLMEAKHRSAPLSAETWELLQAHPQFQS